MRSKLTTESFDPDSRSQLAKAREDVAKSEGRAAVERKPRDIYVDMNSLEVWYCKREGRTHFREVIGQGDSE
jgi:hypothetical protein